MVSPLTGSELDVTRIVSRDNPLLKELRKLASDTTAYRKQGRVWLEGDHLCRAALARGFKPVLGVFAETYWPDVPSDSRLQRSSQ
jgi:RNA methyltransferase, TrmH family